MKHYVEQIKELNQENEALRSEKSRLPSGDVMRRYMVLRPTGVELFWVTVNVTFRATG